MIFPHIINEADIQSIQMKFEPSVFRLKIKSPASFPALIEPPLITSSKFLFLSKFIPGTRLRKAAVISAYSRWTDKSLRKEVNGRDAFTCEASDFPRRKCRYAEIFPQITIHSVTSGSLTGKRLEHIRICRTGIRI